MKRISFALCGILLSGACWAQGLGNGSGLSITGGGSGGGSLVGGTTPITGVCPNGQLLYNNAGILGCQAASAASLSIGSPITSSTAGFGLYVNSSNQLGQFAFGTNVFAALGNPLNAATGLIGYSGALGTPISGNAANLTGYPASALAAGAIPSSATINNSNWSGTALSNANLANSATTVNGQTCTLGSTCTVAAAAGTLTGSTLASGVTASSLTSVGTLAGGATGAGFTVALSTSTLTGQIGLTNLPSLSANTVLGALTATTPSGLAVPSCSGASSALTWTSGTGFGCNTISGGSGTVTSVSVTTANGVSGTVATSTTTPAITLTLGAITPTSINGVPFSQGLLTSVSNIAIGSGALGAQTSNGNSIAIGFAALQHSTAGFSNIAIGVVAGQAITTGGNNVFLGYNAGNVLTTGSNNFGLGTSALSSVVTGTSNIAIGNNAGNNLTTSDSGNTIIGSLSGTAGQSNTLQLGAGSTLLLDYGATASSKWTMTNVGSDTGVTDNSMCITSAGTIYKGSGTLGICLGTSSARYKRDIKPMQAGLPEILALRPVNYFYRAGYGDDGFKNQYGFIAEEGVKVLPDLASLDDAGRPNTFDYLGIVPVLVNAIHEQQAQIAVLESAASQH